MKHTLYRWNSKSACTQSNCYLHILLSKPNHIDNFCANTYYTLKEKIKIYKASQEIILDNSGMMIVSWNCLPNVIVNLLSSMVFTGIHITLPMSTLLFLRACHKPWSQHPPKNTVCNSLLNWLDWLMILERYKLQLESTTPLYPFIVNYYFFH